MFLPCPTCQKNMEHGHGRCPSCQQHCGCSFNPTTRSDHCEFHYAWGSLERDLLEIAVRWGWKRSADCPTLQQFFEDAMVERDAYGLTIDADAPYIRELEAHLEYEQRRNNTL